MELPLLGMQSVSVQLPLLTSLPSSALPAAVAAGLGQYAVQAALGRPEAAAAAAAAAAADGGGAAAAQAQEAAGAAADDVQAAHGELPTGTAADGAGEARSGRGAAPGCAAAAPGTPGGAATPDLLIASPFKVAMALAEELDGSGLPVGMLPQAVGQVEPEASVSGPAGLLASLAGLQADLGCTPAVASRRTTRAGCLCPGRAPLAAAAACCAAALTWEVWGPCCTCLTSMRHRMCVAL